MSLLVPFSVSSSGQYCIMWTHDCMQTICRQHNFIKRRSKLHILSLRWLREKVQSNSRCPCMIEKNCKGLLLRIYLNKLTIVDVHIQCRYLYIRVYLPRPSQIRWPYACSSISFFFMKESMIFSWFYSVFGSLLL